VLQTGGMAARTVGVEEELLLVDALDGHPSPLGAEVVAGSPHSANDEGGEGPSVGHEFKREQAETASPPCSTLDELLAELRRLRAEVVLAAAGQGVDVAALATSPLPVHSTLTDNRRFRVMMAEFGLVARQQLTCGQHVHVAISSRAEGVAVLDRIRPWLSVITAISANSPYWQGEDTGYASYRSVVWGLWPTAGPTEVFGDATGYERAVADLLASGTALDDGMIYFDARLSARFPTLEIRVADVCTDVEDAVLVAGLCRALVETAAQQWRDGVPAPPARVELLRAATWRAARSGIAGDLVDVRARRAVSAWTLIDELIDQLRPALRATGDAEMTDAALARLRARGSGAQAQRAAFQRSNSLQMVVHDAVLRTGGY
jgi:carboxylate-amine ligase